MLCKAVLVAALAAAVVANPVEKRALAPTITLANGNKVVGTVTGVSNQPTVTGQVSAYLAIPFAASPTRFLPPASTSFATKTATTLGPACYQSFSPDAQGSKVRSYFENPFGPTPLPESEDCLHVNVFVPPNTNRNSGKTVMVWIYGGNLALGANAVNIYNGSSLAVNYDVIVVVPNYRTNFFGFSSSPEVAFGSQNSGFLDQRFALQWVRTNIASFGGDPNKVTIFGESAGAYSVKQLLAQPPSPLPYRAAIMESQGYTGGTVLTRGTGPAAWDKVVARFCTNKPSGQTNLQCVQKVPARDLQAFTNDPKNGAVFTPVLDQTYTASNTLDEITSGKFANVPLLIGSNLNDASIFVDIVGAGAQSDLPSVVKQITGIDLGDAASQSGNLFPGLSGFQLIARVATDLAFTCTTSLFARAVASNHSSPVWRYRFDGDFPNVRYFQGIGAYHTSEIPEVFGTYPVTTKYGSVTNDQRNLAKYMQNAWTTFAKNPANGPAPGSWDQFIQPFQLPQIGVLGGTNATTGLSLQPAIYTDYSCAVYGPVLIANQYAF